MVKFDTLLKQYSTLIKGASEGTAYLEKALVNLGQSSATSSLA